MSNVKELPRRWSILIGGKRAELTLPEIFQLRNDCDKVLEHRLDNVEAVIDFVCGKTQIERCELLSKRRTECVSMARFCAWQILFNAGLSYSEIASQFRKHTSTVWYGLKSLKSRREADAKLHKQLAWLENGAV